LHREIESNKRYCDLVVLTRETARTVFDIQRVEKKGFTLPSLTGELSGPGF
jgi:hypothetical protein